MEDIKKLKEITYELTTCCGADCVMCARSKFTRPNINMSLENALLYTSKVVSAGYNAIILGGMGDPLAYPSLHDFLKATKDRFPTISIRLTTTGQLLDSKMIEIICDYVDILKISNYGFSKLTYEAVHRGTLEFEKVQNNLHKICHLKCKHPYIIMSYLDMPINHSEVIPWIEYWSNQGVSEVNVWKMHNWGGHISKREQVSNKAVPCARLNNKHYIIWVSGHVSVCVFDCNQDMLLGDLNKENFDTIDQRQEKIKEKHEQDILSFKNIPCSYCDQIYDREPALLYQNVNGIITKNIIEGLHL